LSDDKHKVTILHKDGREEFEIRHGVALQILDRQCKPLNERLDCRKSECGLCLIYVLEGAKNLNQPLYMEEQTLRAMRVPPSCRLACQTRVFGAASFELQELPSLK
jgi:ferredoxin